MQGYRIRGQVASEAHGTFLTQGSCYLNVGPWPSLSFKTSSVLQSLSRPWGGWFRPLVGGLLKTSVSGLHPDYSAGLGLPPAMVTSSPNNSYLQSRLQTTAERPVLCLSQLWKWREGVGNKPWLQAFLTQVLLWGGSSRNGLVDIMWWIAKKPTCSLTVS